MYSSALPGQCNSSSSISACSRIRSSSRFAVPDFQPLKRSRARLITCAGADEGITAHVASAQNSSVGANGCAFSHMGFCKFIFPADCRARIDYVGEYCGRPYENIVIAGDAGEQGYIVLNLYIFSENDPGRNHHVLPDIAVLTNHTTGHDVRNSQIWFPPR